MTRINDIMTRINDILTRINDIMTRINDILTRNKLVRLVLQATELGTLASRPLCSPSDTEGIVQSKEKLNPAVFKRLLVLLVFQNLIDKFRG
ncbi:hypothetical protein NPIL_616291 [Nephila pilipes]|uniref:Uncharacterized protein n=1 Tax=Nephila pilipes TaxID=299642 RepID=A0A8X6UL82_NEPPI|nr:hypothetical protein NPIL_616291 [Nephila pilipes]